MKLNTMAPLSSYPHVLSHEEVRKRVARTTTFILQGITKVYGFMGPQTAVLIFRSIFRVFS